MKRMTSLFFRATFYKLTLTFVIIFQSELHAQSCKVQLGAYYFDGWYAGSRHITKTLIDSFPEREPKWGWITRTQDIVNEQINLAADAGLSFFSFCWYYRKYETIENSNVIINYYLNSPNRNRLKYCLLVANHKGHEIGPNVWPVVIKEWIKQFKTGSYITVDGKPFLIFFSVESLVKEFGSTKEVYKAFANLKQAAKKEGLKGVTIAASIGPSKSQVRRADSCGFDVLTGYNYHSAGLKVQEGEAQQVPIDTMISTDKRLWNRFTTLSSLPYVPVVTLNYDPRPWATESNGLHSKPYFIGFSPRSVFKAVTSINDWILEHSQQTPKEKIGLLYAWNEYGEGSWLTPTHRQKDSLLKSVKLALSHEGINY